MATRSHLSTTSTDIPAFSNLGTALAENELRGNPGTSGLRLNATAQYRPHGFDTLTIGDQMLWFYSIIVNRTTKAQLVEDDFFGVYLSGLHRESEEAVKMVLDSYAGIPEIQSIYVEKRNTVHKIFVFLNNAQYNRDLMFSLFDRELAIFDRYPNFQITFRYLPLAMGADPDSDIPDAARNIFDRGK